MRLLVSLAPWVVAIAAGPVLTAAHAKTDAPQTAAPVRTGPSADYPIVLGAPYIVDGVTYTPSDALNVDQVGYAAPGSEGDERISIRHRTLPVPSYAEVTALDSGRTILVRVEGRGPLIGQAIAELSPGASAHLGVTSRAPVRIRRVNPPEAERALLRSGQRAPARMETPASLLSVLKRRLNPSASMTTLATTGGPATAAALPPNLVPFAPRVPASGAAADKPAAEPADAAPKVSLATPASELIRDSKDAKKASPAKAVTSSAAAAAVTNAPRASAQGVFVVQTGAFASKANADRSAARTGGSVTSAGKLWRVRSGPFATRAQADAALAKVRAAGYSDARIQRAD